MKEKRKITPVIPLTDEQQKLVEENIALVYWALKPYQHLPTEVYNNISSRLFYRLCVCAQNFDPGRNLRISSYIVRCLKGEIKNYFRDESWVVRPPRPLREMTFSDAVDSIGEEQSEAELMGENPQTIGSCAIPVPLQFIVGNGDDDYNLDIPSNEDLEEETIDRIGGREIVRQIFQLLRPEERMILSLQMKGRSYKYLQPRFNLSREEANKVWKETKAKVKGYYTNILDNLPTLPSQGNRTLMEAVRKKFTPEEVNYLEVRKRLEE